MLQNVSAVGALLRFRTPLRELTPFPKPPVIVGRGARTPLNPPPFGGLRLQLSDEGVGRYVGFTSMWERTMWVSYREA